MIHRLIHRPCVAWAALMLCATLASGCAHTATAGHGDAAADGGHHAPPGSGDTGKDYPSNGAASPYVDLESLSAGTIVHVPTGRQVDFDTMARILAGVRVVYVGEMHTNMEDHEAQLRVIRAMEARHGGNLLIGMEMFARPAQEALDKWVAGEMSVEAFLSVWYENWSEQWNYYAPILRFAREKGLKVVALNASRDVQHGIHADQVPEGAGEWDRDDPYHKAYLSAVFSGHGHGMTERYYDVQLLWEETMAESAARALTAAGDQAAMVILAGGGHVQYGFGIPRRLFARLPVSYATVVPIVTELPADRADLRMNVEPPDFPLPLADFAWALPYRDLEADRVMLGITLDVKKKGVWVQGVMPTSPAERAGVKAGDRIVSLDGHPVNTYRDLKIYLTLAETGTQGSLVIEREGVEVPLSIAYRSMGKLPAPEPGDAGAHHPDR